MTLRWRLRKLRARLLGKPEPKPEGFSLAWIQTDPYAQEKLEQLLSKNDYLKKLDEGPTVEI
jgi:hypothetical protein